MNFDKNKLITLANKTKVLEKKEEIKLIKLWQTKKDEKSLEKILKSYMRLIVSVANKYLHYGLPREDLVQEGIVGIMNAIEKFDLSKGFRLSTYSKWWIRALIQEYILKNWSIVKAGSSASQKALFFNLNKLKKIINYNSFEFMGNNEVQKVAKILKVKSSQVETMENRLTLGDQSLNQTLSDDSNNDLMSLLKDESPTQDIILEQTYNDKEKKDTLYKAINQLKDREKIIILNRKLEEKAKTLEEMGKKLNISKERVRQIENKALQNLRKNILSISNQNKEFFIN